MRASPFSGIGFTVRPGQGYVMNLRHIVGMARGHLVAAIVGSAKHAGVIPGAACTQAAYEPRGAAAGPDHRR